MAAPIRQAKKEYTPRLIFWEVTKGCNLRCIHCRATATELMSPADLPTEKRSTSFPRSPTSPIPSSCSAAANRSIVRTFFSWRNTPPAADLRTALATNGTLVTKDVAEKIKNAGIKRVSISLDGSDATTHDTFRGIPGAFDAAIYGMRNLQQFGVSVQINTTIARHNAHQLPDVLDLGAPPRRRCAAYFPARAGGMRRRHRRPSRWFLRTNTSAC